MPVLDRAPPTRRGVSALVLVVGAALILVIWAASLHFVSSSVRRRVRITETGRRCLDRADEVLEEAVQFLWTEGNEEMDPKTGLTGESLAARVRAIEPGDFLEFGYEPLVRRDDDPTVPLVMDDVLIRMYPVIADGSQGNAEEKFCKKLLKWIKKWSAIPG